MEQEDCTPSHAQTIKMRKFAEAGKLNEDVILSIMIEEKRTKWSSLKSRKRGLTNISLREPRQSRWRTRSLSTGTVPQTGERTGEIRGRQGESGFLCGFPVFLIFWFPLPTPYPFRITSSLPAEKKNKEPVAIHIPPDQYPALPASRDFFM